MVALFQRWATERFAENLAKLRLVVWRVKQAHEGDQRANAGAFR